MKYLSNDNKGEKEEEKEVTIYKFTIAVFFVFSMLSRKIAS